MAKKNKWNDISYGLPPVGVPLIVTVLRHEMGKKYHVLPVVYYMKDYATGDWGFFEFGDLSRRIGPEYFEVIAWKEYPSAFKDPTEEDEE